MTRSAKWIAILSILSLVIAMATQNPWTSILSTTVLLWILTSYAIFRWRVGIVLRGVMVSRRIQGRETSTGILWSGRTYPVEILIKSRGKLARGWILRDLIPEILQTSLASDDSHKEVEGNVRELQFSNWLLQWLYRSLSTQEGSHPNFLLQASQARVKEPSRGWSHRFLIKPRAAGIAILPGVRLQAHDPMHWFRIDTVLACPHRLQVLPGFVEAGELRSLLKHSNAIPQHGIHRQRRPGMGFELLELREYIDGDPPKTIAWKASARRENLMTRQYESEVPIRLQFFIEGSIATRLGGFGLRTIDQMNWVATTLARIATRGGDLVGAFLVANTGIERVGAATGDKGFHGIARALSEYSSSQFPTRFRWTESMQAATYALVCEYYPERLSAEINPLGNSFLDWFRSSTYHQRVQLAAVLAHRYEMSLLDHLELWFNDSAFASCMQRILCEHGVAWMAPMIPADEVGKQDDRPARRYLTQALQQAVLRAKDNEVFVVFSDLLGSSTSTVDLINAIRMAKGRHHRVVVVCTSPSFERPKTLDFPADGKSAYYWANLADQLRLSEQLGLIRQQMREAGVPFSISANQEVIPLVLSEIELARSGRFAKVSSS